MIYNNSVLDEIKEIDNKIIALYLFIIGSLLPLISLYKTKTQLFDKYCGTDYAEKFPNTDNYGFMASVSRLIASAIFLYYAAINLEQAMRKNHNNKVLTSSYNAFYSALLNFIGNIIELYNIYIGGDPTFTP